VVVTKKKKFDKFFDQVAEENVLGDGLGQRLHRLVILGNDL